MQREVWREVLHDEDDEDFTDVRLDTLRKWRVVTNEAPFVSVTRCLWWLVAASVSGLQ